MRSAVAVANFFVRLQQQTKQAEMSGNKLQDLVYLAHGYLLGTLSESLINTAVFACRDGVVVPELQDLGCAGGKRVSRPLALFELDETRGVMVEQIPVLHPKEPSAVHLLKVWEFWAATPAFDLREFVREHGAPWDLIWNDESRALDQPRRIPNATIRLWFRDYLAREMPRRPVQQQHLGDTQAVLIHPDPGRLRSV